MSAGSFPSPGVSILQTQPEWGWDVQALGRLVLLLFLSAIWETARHMVGKRFGLEMFCHNHKRLAQLCWSKCLCLCPSVLLISWKCALCFLAEIRFIRVEKWRTVYFRRHIVITRVCKQLLQQVNDHLAQSERKAIYGLCFHSKNIWFWSNPCQRRIGIHFNLGMPGIQAARLP